MQHLTELDQRIPSGEAVQAILAQSGAVQGLASRLEEVSGQFAHSDVEREQWRAREQDTRRHIDTGLSDAHQTLERALQQGLERRLHEFGRTITNNIQAVKYNISNDRIVDWQTTHAMHEAATRPAVRGH